MTKGELVKKYLAKYPKAPIHTLAKKIYSEHNATFKTVENVRQLVKYYAGKSGKRSLKEVKDKSFIRTEQGTLNPWANFPESYAETREPYILAPGRWLVLSDIHLPYHDESALKTALNYGITNGFDRLLINGDLIDFYQLSRFEKDPRKRSFKQELDSARMFIDLVSEWFKQVVYKLGNHDERYEKWMFVKAPELLDCEEFELQALLKCGEKHVEVVKDKRIISAGKLNILHGHEFPGGSGGVNPARSMYLKASDSLLVGHFHKTSSHTETTLNGDLITTHSTGHLCEPSPIYMPYNKWNHGFATLDLKTDGTYYLQNLRISKGKVY
jgi:predicted phosphodiesterase